MRFRLNFIPFFAEGAEEGFVADDGTEGFEGTDIAFGVQPEAHITAFGVFLQQVFTGTGVECLEVTVGVEFGGIRHRAGYDRFGDDLAVGFGYNRAVDSSRRVLTAGAMVAARKEDLSKVTQDQIDFLAQKDLANGKKTMNAYLWKVCGLEYDESND